MKVELTLTVAEAERVMYALAQLAVSCEEAVDCEHDGTWCPLCAWHRVEADRTRALRKRVERLVRV